jgi:mono/diheme cytochrome c family protein
MKRLTASLLSPSGVGRANRARRGNLGWALALSVFGFQACYAEEPGTGPDVGPLQPGDNTGGSQPGNSGAPSTGEAGSTPSEEGGRAGMADGGAAGSSAPGEGGSGGSGMEPSDAGEPSVGGDTGDGGEPPVVAFACNDPVAEPLPARIAITSPDAPSGPVNPPQTVKFTKTELFQQFQQQTCGLNGCHGGSDDPLAKSPAAFKMTIDSFDQRPDLGTIALERILSSEPAKVMPPGSGDGSKRGADDPIRRLGERLLAWEKAGFPPVLELTLEGEPVDEELPEDPYLLSPELGAKLTNLGSCIPEGATEETMVANEVRDKDDLFASIETSEELPDTLVETDLVSLDSATLARRRVFSYAPTYTLFSDHAGKMRHVRVPVGQTIGYDAASRDFKIPENTRFYKTFSKQVRDKDGKVGYRKMETRLIVSRPDEKLPDGSYRHRSLRAAYAWDRDETIARRVKDPFRNGQPAADRLCTYITDESTPRDPAKNPISDQISKEYCTYMTQEELDNPSSGSIRHYAIPSTERCDQCHMGSSSHSYILGFNPWQVDRRPDGEGGVFEAPTEDELSQLERLLEYGVVSGIAPGQAKLEDSQGERKPRNAAELKAQGYMMGNCVFCHNPNGFPVVQNPVLRPFDLYPSATGGVFQFSLERYSPRAKAGAAQATRFPYITPAFGDYNLSGSDEPSNDNKTRNNVTRETIEGFPQPMGPVVDTYESPPDYDAEEGVLTFLGPWRSLIWRNVYTPFTYAEDGTIFIHMPRNAPGYDCRAHNIMAEWMLSIPSVPSDGAEQPSVEVKADAEPAAYAAAVAEANQRVQNYKRGLTGAYCPEDDDIIDAKVVLAPLDEETGKKSSLSPQDHGITGPRVTPKYPYPIVYLDAVPDHAHWIPTDTTEPPGNWIPRRSNWEEVLATREVPVSNLLAPVIDHVQEVTLSSELRDFALEAVPLGLWHEDCQSRPEVASSPTVGDLLASPTAPFRRWLSGGVIQDDEATEPATAHVHFQSRGEAVFRAICQNCHGREADSRSPLSATITEITGAQTRVANFVAGLFGPAAAPGAYARSEFLINRGATPDEWLARYMVFMGLGGTEATIPQSVLNLVAGSPFYGLGVTAPEVSANMLGSAEKLCLSVLDARRTLPTRGSAAPYLTTGTVIPFARGRGHFELWESLCTYNNEPVVQVFRAPGDGDIGRVGVYRARDDLGNWVYPTDHPVANPRGEVEIGIQPSNSQPWCFSANTQAEVAQVQDWAGDVGMSTDVLPICPPTLFSEALGQEVYRLDPQASSESPLANREFTEHWVRQGAINAGLSAYYYIRGLTHHELTPSLPFDFCRE